MAENEYTWNEKQIELAFLEVEKLSVIIQKLERRFVVPSADYLGVNSPFCQEYHDRDLCASCCPMKVLKEPCEDLDNKDVAWFNMAQAIGRRDWTQALVWARYIRELCSFVAGIRGRKPYRPLKIFSKKHEEENA